MEIIEGWTHKAFPIDDASRVGEARRHAAQLVAHMGWSEVDTGRLALVITELGTNLHRHAQKGRLLIAARPHSDDVEIISIDEGPGIADLPRSMQDGQSSGSTPGTGLGAISRLASEFDIHSAPDGTVIVARVRDARHRPSSAPRSMHIGAICLPAPGEVVSGDAWVSSIDGERLTLMLVDGLGHGPEAHKAARAATAAFAQQPGVAQVDLLQQLHKDIQTTRGAAICLATVDAGASTVLYTGAGNIVGRVLSGVFDKSIVTQPGTVGLQMRKPAPATLDIPPHALVVLHSDGIATRWTVDRIRPLLQRDPALVAAVVLRDHTRHRDDATIVVLRSKE